MTEQERKIPSPLMLKIVVFIHNFIYRISNGRLGKTLAGAPVLLLTVRGRKSGRMLTVPLIYIRTDRGHAVVASKGGAPHHPAWYLNLEAAREARIQVGGDKTQVRTHILMPGDAGYDEIWQKGLAIYPPYAEYKDNTSRAIPIVELLPLA